MAIPQAQRREKSAKGGSGNHPRVSISFDAKTFARLSALAAERKEPFGAAVRRYVALGLNSAGGA